MTDPAVFTGLVSVIGAVRRPSIHRFKIFFYRDQFGLVQWSPADAGRLRSVSMERRARFACTIRGARFRCARCGCECGKEHKVRKVASIFGLIVGLYLVARAVAEPFVVDMADPTTYREDWGGPSLLGVLLVHCGPGVISAILITRALLRHRSETRVGQGLDETVRHRHR